MVPNPLRITLLSLLLLKFHVFHGQLANSSIGHFSRHFLSTLNKYCPETESEEAAQEVLRGRDQNLPEPQKKLDSEAQVPQQSRFFKFKLYQ
jgi:hypothetical protein